MPARQATFGLSALQTWPKRFEPGRRRAKRSSRPEREPIQESEHQGENDGLEEAPGWRHLRPSGHDIPHSPGSFMTDPCNAAGWSETASGLLHTE